MHLNTWQTFNLQGNGGKMSTDNGYVYIATNPLLKGIVQIGCAYSKPTENDYELNNFTTPSTLEVIFQIPDAKKCFEFVKSRFSNEKLGASVDYYQLNIDSAAFVIMNEIAGAELIYSKNEKLKGRAIVDEPASSKVEFVIDNKDFKLNEMKNSSTIPQEVFVRYCTLCDEIVGLREERQKLGNPPEKFEPDVFIRLWVLAFMPLPWGWITWVLFFKSIYHGDSNQILVTGALLITGFFARKREVETKKSYLMDMEPFSRIDQKIDNARWEVNEIESIYPSVKICYTSKILQKTK